MNNNKKRKKSKIIKFLNIIFISLIEWIFIKWKNNECVSTNIFSDLHRSNDSWKKSTKRLMTVCTKIGTYSFIPLLLYFCLSWLHNYESLVINYFRNTLDFLYVYGNIYLLSRKYIYTRCPNNVGISLNWRFLG